MIIFNSALLNLVIREFIAMIMSSVKQIFDSLPGIWRLTRETLTPLKQWQNSGAECIKANGYAAFIIHESDPNWLIYSEKVTINSDRGSGNAMNGMQAKQKYKYRYDKLTETLTKYFFDDRLFYELKIIDASSSNREGVTEVITSSDLKCSGSHLCIEDVYDANYSFQNSEQFKLNYSVNGPKKCYQIITKYEKCNGDEVAQLGLAIMNNEIL